MNLKYLSQKNLKMRNRFLSKDGTVTAVGDLAYLERF